MSVPITMKFPPEFAELLRNRAAIAPCFPAQYVHAMFRVIERAGLQTQLSQEIAQVKAAADLRHRDGARLGGQSGPASNHLTR